MSGDATDVQMAVCLRSVRKRIEQRLAQGRTPVALKAKHSSKYVRQGFGWIGASGVGYREAGPMKTPDAGNLLLRITDKIRVDGLFRFEHTIHAFRGYDCLTLIIKDKWRILSIKNDNIDLFTECTFAIYNVGLCGVVSSRQIRFK